MKKLHLALAGAALVLAAAAPVASAAPRGGGWYRGGWNDPRRNAQVQAHQGQRNDNAGRARYGQQLRRRDGSCGTCPWADDNRGVGRRGTGRGYGNGPGNGPGRQAGWR